MTVRLNVICCLISKLRFYEFLFGCYRDSKLFLFFEFILFIAHPFQNACLISYRVATVLLVLLVVFLGDHDGSPLLGEDIIQKEGLKTQKRQTYFQWKLSGGSLKEHIYKDYFLVQIIQEVSTRKSHLRLKA